MRLFPRDVGRTIQIGEGGWVAAPCLRAGDTMTADSLVAETATTTAELKESPGASNLLSSFKIGMEWANFPVQQEAASAQSGSSEMEKGTTGALHGFLGGVKGGFQAGLDGFRGAVDSSSSRLANFSSSLSARPSMPDASSWPSKKAQSEQDDAGVFAPEHRSLMTCS